MISHSIVMCIYAILLIAGGIIGYVKAGSMPSLVMGTLFSFLSLASAYATYRGMAFGKTLALGISLLLAAFFGYRFFLSYQFMPAGLMVLLSLAVFAYTLWHNRM